MKKIFYLAGVCCMSLCLLGACSSDDEPVKSIELAEGTSTSQTVFADETHQNRKCIAIPRMQKGMSLR